MNFGQMHLFYEVDDVDSLSQLTAMRIWLFL